MTITLFSTPVRVQARFRNDTMHILDAAGHPPLLDLTLYFSRQFQLAG